MCNETEGASAAVETQERKFLSFRVTARELAWVKEFFRGDPSTSFHSAQDDIVGRGLARAVRISLCYSERHYRLRSG